MRRRLIWFFTALVAVPCIAVGQNADPAETRPSNIHILSAADHALYTRAFLAAAKGDWTMALTLGNQGQGQRRPAIVAMALCAGSEQRR